MTSGKSRVIVISIVILLSCAGAGYYWHAGQESAAPRHGLREAPGFSLKDTSGLEHGIEGFRGKVVLLHFWAAWCPPCLSEMPEILGFARAISAKDQRIEVVTISEDEKWADAEKVLPSTGLPANMISLLDENSKVSDQYGTYQFPETYLIDPQGRIITKWIGAQPWTNPKVEELLMRTAGSGSS